MAVLGHLFCVSIACQIAVASPSDASSIHLPYTCNKHGEVFVPHLFCDECKVNQCRGEVHQHAKVVAGLVGICVGRIPARRWMYASLGVPCGGLEPVN